MHGKSSTRDKWRCLCSPSPVRCITCSSDLRPSTKCATAKRSSRRFEPEPGLWRPGFDFRLLRDPSFQCGGEHSRNHASNRDLPEPVLNRRSPEVWRKTGAESELRRVPRYRSLRFGRGGAPLLGFSAPLYRSQRMLAVNGLAEGVRLGSNGL